MKKTLNGFTIVELLIVIAVIGILSTVGIISFSSIQVNARDYQRSSKITILSETLEKYYDKNGEYPSCAAMSTQPALSVTTNTLKGMDPNILTTPTAVNGFNSVLCGDPTLDTFGYIGGGNDYKLEYKQKSNSQVITLDSRRHAYTLTLTAGTGGTVNAGGTYNAGTFQTITATPSTNYIFGNWSGSSGCIGAFSHSISMDATKSCTASFIATFTDNTPSYGDTAYLCTDGYTNTYTHNGWIITNVNYSGTGNYYLEGGIGSTSVRGVALSNCDSFNSIQINSVTFKAS